MHALIYRIIHNWGEFQLNELLRLFLTGFLDGGSVVHSVVRLPAGGHVLHITTALNQREWIPGRSITF